jgi:Zn-dependent protease
MESWFVTGFLVLIFLATVTFHEFSHGLAAYFLGDPTAKERGRLTLNPFRHIDLWWTLVLPFALLAAGLPAIGMAKPVPVDFGRLRRPKRDMIWVALAGPGANLLLASLLAAWFHQTGWPFLLLAVYFNAGLAVFNLIPIPPLDGSKILIGLLPGRWAYEFARLEKFGFLVIIVLVWTRILWHAVVPGVNLFCRLWQVPGIGPLIP